MRKVRLQKKGGDTHGRQEKSKKESCKEETSQEEKIISF